MSASTRRCHATPPERPCERLTFAPVRLRRISRHRMPEWSAPGKESLMGYVWIPIVVVVVLLVLTSAIRVVKQYERGVLFRLGKVIGVKPAGLTVIIPFVDVLHRVRLPIV